MAERFCPSCGTEVDEDARFCPSCGATLSMPEDEVTRDDVPVLPEAPLWPDPEPGAEPEPAAEPEADAEASADVPPPDDARLPEPEADAAGDDASPDAGLAGKEDPEPKPSAGETRSSEPAPEPAPAAPSPPAAPAPHSASAGRTDAGPDLPITWPTTLAGWLIGGGSALGALALIPRLNEMVSLLLFLALLGIAATVFLVDRLPHVPHLRLLTLVVVMIGVGVAFDRAAFTVRGLETLLLVAMLAAAGGVLLIELDRDRPFPPPEASA